MLPKLRIVAALAVCVAVSAPAAEKFQHPGPVRLDHDGTKWAERTLKKMSLEQKVGQMFLIWVRAQFMNINSPEYQQLRDTIRKYHIGALGMTVRWEPPFLYKNQPYEAAMLLNELQRDAEFPLLVAADFERGVSKRLYGTTIFPEPMAFGAADDPAYAEASGRITAQEARAIGVHWNFFPVADVNSNPANPIINTRAFGEDPQQVSELVAAYIKGARAHGLLTTAKHFPGHGDTATDSHLGVAMVNGNLGRLHQVELPPFQKAIDAGVDAVMVAHVSVPALEPDPKVVASTSHRIVTELLREQMGFKGLVVPDAMDMNGLMRLYSAGGVSGSGAAAVAAVKAGVDMILIPQDLDAAYQGLIRAVRGGNISEKRIDDSVLRILKMKASVGLNKARLVDPGMLDRTVDAPENRALAQQIADAAVTLVRDNGQLLPLQRTLPGTSGGGNAYTRVGETRNRVVAVILTDDVRTEAGRGFERELRARVRDANVFWVDARSAAAMTPQILAAVDQAQAVLAPVYLIPSAGMANRLPDVMAALLHAILEHQPQRTAVLAMGNPYIGTGFPEAQNYLCTFSEATVSETAAVRALFGEIAIHGRLPVTIPDIAQRGAGLNRAPLQQGRLNSHANDQAHP